MADALVPTWLSAACLTLEVTESVVMASPDRTMTILAAIEDVGVRISIDDFGTGYLSLRYLQQLRAQELKIDRSFVMDLDVNARVLLEGMRTSATTPRPHEHRETSRSCE